MGVGWCVSSNKHPTSDRKGKRKWEREKRKGNMRSEQDETGGLERRRMEGEGGGAITGRGVRTRQRQAGR